MNKIFRNLSLALLSALALTACEDDAPQISPDTNRPGTAEDVADGKTAVLMSQYNPGNDIISYNIGDPMDETLDPSDLGRSDNIKVVLTKPLDHDITIRIGMPEKFGSQQHPEVTIQMVADFKNNHNIDLDGPDHDGFIKFNNAENIYTTIKAGETESNPIEIFFYREYFMAGRSYLFPVIAENTSTGETIAQINYIVTALNDISNESGEKPFVFVGHVDTEVLNPLIAVQFGLTVEKTKRRKPAIPVYQGRMFDIINLRTAAIRKSSNGSTELYLNADIAHVLKNGDTYIKPLQYSGIKTCLTIKGGGNGVGFSNLTDEQISNFVNQVKITVDMYGLDGINLYDENAGYDKSDAAPTSGEAFAKLIKALKTAMPDKLLTLVDTRETTEALCDPQAGISVGDYIDYAWSPATDIVCPYQEGFNTRPLAGMSEDRYASINLKELSTWSDDEMQEFVENSIFSEWGMEMTSTPFSATKVMVLNNITYYDYIGEIFWMDLMMFGLLATPVDDNGYRTDYTTTRTGAVYKYYAFKKDW